MPQSFTNSSTIAEGTPRSVNAKFASISVKNASDLGGGKYHLEHGTVQINGEEFYTFTANLNIPSSVSQDIIFVVINGDGDSAEHSLSIDIPQSINAIDEPDVGGIDADNIEFTEVPEVSESTEALELTTIETNAVDENNNSLTITHGTVGEIGNNNMYGIQGDEYIYGGDFIRSGTGMSVDAEECGDIYNNVIVYAPACSCSADFACFRETDSFGCSQ